MAMTLYLVGTPIGNLEDMTFRAVQTLKSVPVIIAEDTRHTRILCDRFNIGARLLSMPAFSEGSRAVGMIQRLVESGQDWAMVSDAGMPGISDPGARLVECAIESGVTVIPIPGPSAVVTALAASGLPTARFYFAGFLPRKGEQRRRVLDDLKRLSATVVVYESPERLYGTLVEFADIFGNRRGVVCRELTKIHEEFVRGSLLDLANHFQEKPKGEITLLVEGAPETENLPALSEDDLIQMIGQFLQEGKLTVKEISKELSEITGKKKNDIYAMVLKVKEELKKD